MAIDDEENRLILILDQTLQELYESVGGHPSFYGHKPHGAFG